MSVDEIMNGQQTINGFPGLIPLVESYLDTVNIDVETKCALARYLALIRGRANGSLWTAAKWIRHFVRDHPEYKKDSVVTTGITYDLVKAAERITVQEGRDGFAKEMFGANRVQS
jgi:glutamate--cysteine ligase catalytic subunit